MNDRLDDFKNKLRDSGVVRENELRGCSPQEIIQLEKKYGKLPTAYKQVMELLGKCSAGLVSYEFDFHINEIISINEEYLSIFQEELENMNMDKNILLICSRYGDHFHFIWTNNECDDCPVFFWLGEEDFIKLNSSMWEWMDLWIEDAQHLKSLREKAEEEIRRKRNKDRT